MVGVDRSGGTAEVQIDSPCSRCGAGCWRLYSSRAAATLPVPIDPLFSAKLDGSVAISVSRSGLTRAAALLFGPVVLAVLLVAVASNNGLSDIWLTGLALTVLPAALWFSRVVLKHRAAPLLDLDARAKVC